jgi:hypothetical protein
MNYTVEKNISERRATFNARDSNGKLILEVSIYPINLYKDMRLNFRDDTVPCGIDAFVYGNICSAELIDYEELHSLFFDTIVFDYMTLHSFKMFILNIKEPLLYNFCLQNMPLLKERITALDPNKTFSWMQKDEAEQLIKSWNVPFEFQQPECKFLLIYRDSEFSKYQTASWIKRRVELSNGKYL